jgi:hypothetical protein
MTINYRIDLIDTSGVVQDVITTFDGASMTLVSSGKGILTLRLSGFDLSTIARFAPDVLLEVSRVNYARSGVWQTVGTFIHKSPVRALFGTGNRSFTSYAPSPEELLDASSIAYYAGPSAQKSGQLTTVLREFVNENATANATTANGRIVDHIMPLALGADPAMGGVWSGRRVQKNLLEVLQELVAWGYDSGQRVDFRVVRSGGYNFVFECGELGTDYTATAINPSTGKNTAGNAPIVLSPLLQNVLEFTQSESRYNEATVVIALGQGELDARQTAVAIAPTATISPIAARESIAQAYTISEGASLPEFAAARLENMVAQKNIVIKPDPQVYALFDDYNVGDFVTAEDFDGVRSDFQIVEANIAINSAGDRIEDVAIRIREI